MGLFIIDYFLSPSRHQFNQVSSVCFVIIHKTLDRHITGMKDVLFRRGVAQSGSAPALGAGCREFESLHPDHSTKRIVSKSL